MSVLTKSVKVYKYKADRVTPKAMAEIDAELVLELETIDSSLVIGVTETSSPDYFYYTVVYTPPLEP